MWTKLNYKSVTEENTFDLDGVGSRWRNNLIVSKSLGLNCT